MCAYAVNDFSQLSTYQFKKLSAPEVVDSYLNIRKNKDNPFYKTGTTLNEVYNSVLSNESTLIDSFSKPSFLKDKKLTTNQKYNNYIE